MAGLLDAFSSPEAVFALGLLDAGSAKPVRTSLGGGLLGAMTQAQAVKRQQEEQQQRALMQALQMKLMESQIGETQAQAAQRAEATRKAQEQAALDARFRGMIPSPQMSAAQQALAGGGGPTQENAIRLAPVDPLKQLMFDAMQTGQMKPLDYVKLQQPPKPEDKVVGGSLVRVGPKGVQELYRAPEKADKPPTSVQEFLYAQKNPDYSQWDQSRRKAGATNLSVNTGQRGLDNTLKLRGDFRSEPIYKAHQETQSAYAQIKQALAQASPAGDLAGATKVMKILDPTSVVRESELGMAMAASGLLDRLQNYASMTLSGQKLTPTQRKDFQTLADRLFAESVKQYNAKRSEYQGIAERNGLNTADVLGPDAALPSGAPLGSGMQTDLQRAAAEELRRRRGGQ